MSEAEPVHATCYPSLGAGELDILLERYDLTDTKRQREIVGAFISETVWLKQRLRRIREMLKKVVVSEGEDSGVILLSDDSPTRYDEHRRCQVYLHKDFSPLGDALVAVCREAVIDG